MASANEVAFALLDRLLAGEQEELLTLHLAMLLEKSFPLASSDELYQEILPPELAGLKLSPDIRDEIVSIICAEVARNPTEALISTISFTGADLPTRTAAKILIYPPHTLTMGEVWGALSLVTKFLPYRLREQPDFLPGADLQRLVQLAVEFKDIEETGTGQERSARIGIKMHAAEFLRSLKLYGIAVRS